MASGKSPRIPGQKGSKPPSGGVGIPTPVTSKPKALARRDVTPALRQQYRDLYGEGWKKNAEYAAAYDTARRAAVKKQMGGS